jgi:hypothetical protein
MNIRVNLRSRSHRRHGLKPPPKAVSAICPPGKYFIAPVEGTAEGQLVVERLGARHRIDDDSLPAGAVSEIIGGSAGDNLRNCSAY